VEDASIAGDPEGVGSCDGEVGGAVAAPESVFEPGDFNWSNAAESEGSSMPALVAGFVSEDAFESSLEGEDSGSLPFSSVGGEVGDVEGAPKPAVGGGVLSEGGALVD